MKHIFTISLCLLVLSLSAQVGCIDFNACNYDSNANNNCEAEIETFDNFNYMGSLNGSSYYLYQNTSTWNSAQQMCQSLGGYLVTISSTEENNLVKSYIPSWSYPGSPQIWIGYALVNGVWEWVNGEANVYENFASGEPSGGSETIGLMWQNGTWNDGLFNSGAQISFLMERNCCDYPDFGEICQIQGCLDNTASNFNPNASEDDGSCAYTGCLDSFACNYNPDAIEDDDSCDYSCCPGPGCCLEGTTWNADLGGCIPTVSSCPEDLDGDGGIGVNDLMQLLSSFGTMCEEPETVEFSCGDPVPYHGYDYATVQIGEQCWFAENLRTDVYTNGDVIAGDLSDAEWATTNSGAQATYNNDPAMLNDYGRFYNWYAVDDSRGLCPTEWNLPTHEEFNALTEYVGGAQVAGGALKASVNDMPEWNGTNDFGFNAKPTGYRNNDDGVFLEQGETTIFWASTNAGASSWYRMLQSYTNWILAYSNGYVTNGYTVRCLRVSD
jgi:uncharacterized protein (TIGR02145 family)